MYKYSYHQGNSEFNHMLQIILKNIQDMESASTECYLLRAVNKLQVKTL